MVKKNIFSRILFRHVKKTPLSQIDDKSSSGSSSSSEPTKKKPSSKQQHLLSLLKSTDPDLFPDIPPQQHSFYSTRLYLATVQKLKRHQPFSMERQRAAYHLLSCLVIQQELDRFEPEFEYIGRKPRKTRYISTLLDTPVDSITPFRHPVLEATKRKSFVETSHVIMPSSPSLSSLSTSSLVSTSSISSSTTCSSSSFKRNQSHYFLFHPSYSNLKKASHLWSSRSDPHLHASVTPTEDEDNIPLAILKTRRVDIMVDSL
ncbi:hypothetical protein BC941DRAFT_445552 [Chlamydoabsidia padenii]|nr:hypothetical protein BC941DRAFT_445552 [Chlamydoabsidia padenii]